MLGAAAVAGMRGYCFLGEIPQVFAQVPFPKASLAILESFTRLTHIHIDLDELAEQAKAVEEQLGELLTRVEEQYGQQPGVSAEGEEGEEGEGYSVEEDDGEPEEEGTREREGSVGYKYEEPDEPVPLPAVQRIEELFTRAASDRSKAFELKRELDRLGLFKQYEDRFLDLFKHREG